MVSARGMQRVVAAAGVATMALLLGGAGSTHGGRDAGAGARIWIDVGTRLLEIDAETGAVVGGEAIDSGDHLLPDRSGSGEPFLAGPSGLRRLATGEWIDEAASEAEIVAAANAPGSWRIAGGFRVEELSEGGIGWSEPQPSGTVSLALARSGLWRLEPGAILRFVPAASDGGEALAWALEAQPLDACLDPLSEELVVADGAGVTWYAADGSRVAGTPLPGARRVACGRSGTVWVVAGTALLRLRSNANRGEREASISIPEGVDIPGLLAVDPRDDAPILLTGDRLLRWSSDGELVWVRELDGHASALALSIRPGARRANPGVADEAPPVPEPDESLSSAEVSFSGRVVSPGGVPVAGAQFVAFGREIVRATSAADGTFATAPLAAEVGDSVLLTSTLELAAGRVSTSPGEWSAIPGANLNLGDETVSFPCGVEFDVGLFPAGELNGDARAAVAFDDGSGPALYVGGKFSTAGGVPASRIAKWDGNEWSAVGAGLSGTSSAVYALTVHDDGTGPALYAGGNFTSSGGAPVYYVARWTGSEWVQAGDSMGGTVMALASYDSGSGPELYATGYSSSKKRVARLEGATWVPVAGGANNTGFALRVFDGQLYFGGVFTTVGGVAASRIARWDGTSWSDVDGGVTGGSSIAVYALTTWDDGTGPALVAAGRFTTAGGGAASHVALWDGLRWSPIGGGLGVLVYALATFDDGWGESLYAAGTFTTVSGTSYGRLARWSGSGWEPVGSGTVGTNGTIFTLVPAELGGTAGLFVGGSFTTAGGAGAGRYARIRRAPSCADTQAPRIRIVDPSGGETVATGSPPLRFGFADSGSGVDAATIQLSVDGTPVGIDCAAGADTADCTLATPLAPWANTLSVTVRDFAANLSPPHAVELFVADAVPPTIDVLEPLEGALVGSLRPTLRVGYADAGSGVDVATLAILWNGGPIELECQTGPSEAICTPLAEVAPGPVTLTATISDLAGNPSVPAQREFTVAAPPPTIGTTFAGTVRFEGGSSAEGATVWLAEDPTRTAVTAGDGSYSIAEVEIGGATAVRLDAKLIEPGATWLGFTTVAPVPDGTTAADLTLRARCDGGFSRLDLIPDGASLTKVPHSISNAPLVFAGFDDGSGAKLYVGGAFNYGGSGELGRVARWEPSGWAAAGRGFGHLGNGLQPDVRAFVVFDDGSGPALYAGGSFSAADNTPSANLARWNGVSWTEAAAGTDGRVTGLATFDDGSGDELFASGDFTRVGVRVPWSGGDSSVPADHVAKWDGTSWSDASAGVEPTNIDTIPLTLSAFDSSGGRRLFLWEPNGYQIWERIAGVWQSVVLPWEAYSIKAVVVHDDGSGPELFVHAGGIGIRKWNGTDWTPVLDDDYNYKSLASFDDGSGGALFAAGYFPDLSGYDGTEQLRRWDGSSWSAPLGPASEIAAVEGLGAAGSLLRLDPLPFATWQGGAWIPLSTTSDVVGDVTSVAIADTPAGEIVLFAGPTRVGPIQLDGGVYGWDGTSVTAAVAGLPGGSAVISVSAGIARRVFAVDQSNGQVAEWNGGGWSPLGGPLGSAVYDLEWTDLGDGATLYAGAGDLWRWNGAAWQSLGNPGTTVGEIETLDGWLYTRTHRFDGASWEAWGAGNPLRPSDQPGSGMFDAVSFDPASSMSALEPPAVPRMAPVGFGETPEPPLGSGCSAFEAFGGQLHAGGSFASAGGALHYGYAAWNGTSWGSGVGSACGFLANRFLSGYQPSSAMPGSVCALVSFDDGTGAKLVLGGDMAAACLSSNTASLLGYRNVNLGEGVDGPSVRALATGTWGGAPAVVVGGGFGEAEGERAGRLAIWHAAPDWSTCSTAGQPPVVTITSPVEPVTTLSSVVVAGTVDEPATLKVNGTPIVVASDLTFSFPSGPLAEGSNHFFLEATDATGLSSSRDYTLMLDSVPPSIAFAAPADGARVLTSTPPIDLVFSDAGAGIDLGAFVVEAGGLPLPQSDCIVRENAARCVPSSALPAGPASFTARISDRAGLASPDAVLSVVVDPSAGSTWTTVVGSVVFDGGAPAAGARVRLLGRSGVETATLADGSFALPVPGLTDDAPIQVVAEATQGAQAMVAASSPLPPVPGGTTPVGVLTLRAACELAATPGLFGKLGLDGPVRALAVFDDGAGPALYVGGSGVLVGSGSDSNLVRWSGSEFEPVAGAPTTGPVRALAVFDDGTGEALYVGGSFNAVGGQAMNGIARWDGASWSGLGGGLMVYSRTPSTSCAYSPGSVYALRVFDDGSGPALYAGGYFTLAGGSVQSEMVARWDGAGWSGLGAPAACYYIGFGVVGPKVFALESYDDGSGAQIYAAGSFSTIGGTEARNVARLDGASWTALDIGIGRVVNGIEQPAMVDALAVYDSGEGPELVAAGIFNRAGSSETPVGSIARWNGDRWAPLGAGLEVNYTTLQVQTGIQALAVHDAGTGAALYAAGTLTGTFGVKYGAIARWNGATWSPLGTGLSNPGEGGMALLSWNGDLVAGGGFLSAGGLGVDRIARWVDGAWLPFGDGLDGDVRALALFDDGTGTALYLGGDFLSAAGRRLDHVARWDGTALRAVAGGTDGPVHALAVHDDGSGSMLYVGGEFAAAGGSPAANVARWNGGAWQSLATGLTRVSGPAGAWALTVFDDGSGPALYAGGLFDQAGGTPATNVARWSGGGWGALGGGVDNRVRALAAATVAGTSSLYVGGEFSTAGGASASRIGAWDGVRWSVLGSGLSSTVRALVPWPGEKLLVAGEFTGYAKLWDGSSWSSLAGGSPNQKAESLALWDDGRGVAAFVGGSFGTPGSRVARWDGTAWSPLGSGADVGSVLAMASAEEPGGSVLYLGGSFGRFDGVPSSHLARWTRPLYCGDSTGPVVTITSPTESSWVTQSRPRIDFTMTDAMSGVDPGTIALEVDGAPLAATCSTSSDAATCWPETDLAEGTRSLRIAVDDLVGNQGAATVAFSVDTIPPGIDFDDPVSGSILTTSTPTIRFDFLETGAGIDPPTLSIRLEANGPAGFDCSYTAVDAECVASAPIADTALGFFVTIDDLAGNRAQDVAASFFVDTLAPEVAIAHPADGATVYAEPDPIVVQFLEEGSGADPASLLANLDGAPIAPVCTFDESSAACVLPAALAPGAHALAVSIADLAGHRSTDATSAFTYTPDADPPSLGFVVPTPGATFDPQTTPFELAWSDAVSGVDESSLNVLANGAPAETVCTPSAGGTSCRIPQRLVGAVTLTAEVADLAGNRAAPAAVAITVPPLVPDLDPPSIELLEPDGDTHANVSPLRIRGRLSETATLTVDGQPTTVYSDRTFRVDAPLVEGSNSILLEATDPSGNIGQLTLLVELDNTPPLGLDDALLTYADSVDGEAAFVGAAGCVLSSEPDLRVIARNLETGAVGVATVAGDRSFSDFAGALPGDRVEFRVVDLAGNESPAVERVTTGTDPVPQDPDPSGLGSALDSPFCREYSFLWSGDAPTQFAVLDGAIDCGRAAVVRARVLDPQGAPIAGARVHVPRQPGVGSTFSRADGWFDLALNGGGPVFVEIDADGHLPVQRSYEVDWQDIRGFEEVVLTPRSTVATTLDLSSPDEMQSAQGEVATDASGSRRPTLLVAGGTSATANLPDGSTLPLPVATIRMTELTVGDRFEQALPAPLPSTMAPTFVVDLSIDEASAAGATSVEFDQPLPLLVENFLGIPVGTRIATASWSGSKSQWRPESNGLVVGVLSEVGGRALLDLAGDGTPADAAALTEEGIDDAELRRIALLYEPGQELMRARIGHFSYWYFGLVYWAEHGAPPLDLPLPRVPDELRTEGAGQGGFGGAVDVENQILGEALPITGTPIALTYGSDRVPGRKAPMRLRIPVTGPTVSLFLAGIEVVIEVAGRREVLSLPTTPNQVIEWEWDGLDALGRRRSGPTDWKVRIDYAVDATFLGGDQPPAGPLFDLPSGLSIGGDSRGRIRHSRASRGIFPVFDAEETFGIGGWGLSILHRYEPLGETLFYGSGARRTWLGGPQVEEVLERVAGTGVPGEAGDDGPARDAELNGPTGVFATSDGGVLIADTGNCRIRRVDRDGFLSTVAGTDCSDPDGNALGDGGPAVQAHLHLPEKAAEAPDGTIYIADTGHGLLRRVRNGVIDTLLDLRSPECEPILVDLDVDPTGAVWLAVRDWIRFYGRFDECTGIWKIGVDGAAHHLSGPWGGDKDVFNLNSLDYSASGVIATVAGSRVEEVRLDGTLPLYPESVLPGTWSGPFRRDYFNEQLRFWGDGRPASHATRYYLPKHIAVAPDRTTYVADSANRRIRVIRPDGLVDTYVGGGDAVVAGDGQRVEDSALGTPYGVALTNDGTTLYFSDRSYNQVWKVALPAPERDDEYEIPSRDGGVIFVFDGEGVHLRTEDSRTRRAIWTFTYDIYPASEPTGRERRLVTGVEDAYGNHVTIYRGADGTPSSIDAPFGQTTTLGFDGDGYLQQVSRSVGTATETVTIGSRPDGLISTLQDPKGGVYSYQWDTEGRLAHVGDPATGSLDLTQSSESREGRTITGTSAMNRSGNVAIDFGSQRDILWTHTGPTGLASTERSEKGGIWSTTSPAGVASVTKVGNDRERLGPLVDDWISSQVTTPGGRTLALTSETTAFQAFPADELRTMFRTEKVTHNGKVSTISYDGVALTVTVTSPTGRQSVTQLDELGRVEEARPPGIPSIRYSYDGRGRLERVETGSGAELRSTTYTYNPTNGYLDSVTDALGRTVTFERDDAGRVTKQILPDLREIQFDYDLNGNLTKLTPPSRPDHVFDHTALDQLETYTPPDAGFTPRQTSWAYNADGQPTSVTRPDGQQVLYSYEPSGRLDYLTLPQGVVNVSYDAKGRTSVVSAPGGVATTLGYDGHLVTSISTTGPVAGSIAFDYDDDFALTGRTLNGSSFIAFGYDDDGLLTQAGALGLSRNAQTGFLETTALGNTSDARTYTGFGELDEFTGSVASVPVYGYDLDRDVSGRIVRKTETVGGTTTVWDYGYHPERGWLEHVWRDGVVVESYSYDDNGNRTSWSDFWGSGSATYDDQDRLLSYGPTTYTYTKNGELLTKTAGPDVTLYQYDVRGALLGVDLPTGVQIDYLVDSGGRRIGKKVDGVLVQGFLYGGGLAPVAETNGSGQIVSSFVYATKLNVPDYLVKSGTLYRVFTDHLGSVRLVIDAATGAIAQQLDYDPWGRITLDTNPGFQPFAFAGGLYDHQTGLVRFGARDYDPETGRWTAKDPIGFGGGSALVYEYCSEDPINCKDPSGLWGFPWEALDALSYEISSREFATAADALWNDPTWDNALWTTTSLITAMADGAALMLPVVPATGGLTKLGVRGGANLVDSLTDGSKTANLLDAGHRVPNATGDIVSFVTSRDEVYYRVFSGNSTTGRFLVKTAPASRKAATESLALQPGNLAECIQAVVVPAGTRLQRSIAMAAFGHAGGAEQFELFQKIPPEAFGPCVPLR